MDCSNLIGLPYLSGGRSELGADCWGIVYLFHGKQVPSYSGSYKCATNTESVSAHINATKETWVDVDFKDRRKGDVIVFNIRGLPVHVGVVLNDYEMIHTLAGHNSCIERYDSHKWANRIEGVYRWM